MAAPSELDKLIRAVGITLPDGRRFQRGVLTSAGDAGRTDATSAQASRYEAATGGGMPAAPGGSAGFNPYTGGIDVRSYVGSRYDPNFAANNAPQMRPLGAPAPTAMPAAAGGFMGIPGATLGRPAPIGGMSQEMQMQVNAGRQTLLGLAGTDPTRNYTPETVARATPGQVLGELNAIGPRMQMQKANAPKDGQVYASPQAAQEALGPGVDFTGTPEANGGVRVTSVSPRSAPEKRILSPEEQASAAAMSAESTGRVKSAQEYLGGISSRAGDAYDFLSDAQDIERLYSEGAQSGVWQAPITTGRAIVQRLGGDDSALASQQALEAKLAEVALRTTRAMLKGQGAVTVEERKRVEQAAASIGRSKEANMAIIDIAKRAAQRHIAADDLRQQLIDDGKSDTEIEKQVRKFYKDNSLTPAKAEAPASAAQAPSPYTSMSVDQLQKRREELLAKQKK